LSYFWRAIPKTFSNELLNGMIQQLEEFLYANSLRVAHTDRSKLRSCDRETTAVAISTPSHQTAPIAGETKPGFFSETANGHSGLAETTRSGVLNASTIFS
jgi:hypothetical protein